MLAIVATEKLCSGVINVPVTTLIVMSVVVVVSVICCLLIYVDTDIKIKLFVLFSSFSMTLKHNQECI